MATKPKQTVKTNTKSTGTTKTTGNTKTKTSVKPNTKLTGKGQKAYIPPNIEMGKRGQGTEIGDPALIKGKFGYNTNDVGNQNLNDYADFKSNVDRQNRLAGGLEEAVAGRGPSVAELQFQKSKEDAMAGNSAIAASAQGGNRALAARSAMYANAQMGQAAARDSAILRAQEQIQARGELANAIQQGRAADLGFASTQAGMNQEAALANANARNTAAQTNAAMGYTLAKQNQDTINAARQKQADLAAGIRQAGIGAGAQVRSAGIMGGASMYGSDASLAGTLATLGVRTKESDRQNAQTKRQQNIDIGTGIVNGASKAFASGAGG